MSDNKKNAQYYYSPSTNGFYSDVLKSDYETAGTWPDDIITISNAEYDALLSGQASGQVIVTDVGGLPQLNDVEQTQEAIILSAAAKKKALLSLANNAITPLLDAIELGIATDEEKADFAVLREYRVFLNRVDTQMAPDITWPDIPTLLIATADQ
ncbi:tail fiber assembly protein [Pectobacterium aroidearum]|uniref:tail fiber assembly protein n=1 Tax=Pectobacterium aroidearum TaxID=1201031 RepID=UPI001CD31A99|nr:tail fiber assembly protein [Pectobacterium aroidearum]